MYFYIPVRERARSTALYWLATLGKWSLADVMVICILLGVLTLSIPLSTEGALQEMNKIADFVILQVANSTTVEQAAAVACGYTPMCPASQVSFAAIGPSPGNPSLLAATVNAHLATGDGLGTNANGVPVACARYLRNSCKLCQCVVEYYFPSVPQVVNATDNLFRNGAPR